MASADLHLAKEQRRIEPATLERIDDLLRDLRHLGDIRLETIDDALKITHQPPAIELVMIAGQGEIGSVLLQNMQEPVRQFDICIARALGLAQRLNETVITQPVELAGDCLEADIGHRKTPLVRCPVLASPWHKYRMARTSYADSRLLLEKPKIAPSLSSQAAHNCQAAPGAARDRAGQARHPIHIPG